MFIKTINQTNPQGRESSFDYIRIDRGDTWSMDVTLARIIHPMLQRMRVSTHGVPSEFVPNTHGPQLVFDFIDEQAPTDHEKAGEIWAAVLDKMIYSFKEVAAGQYLGGDFHMSASARTVYLEQVQEGLNLFSKHYFSLWT